MMIGKPLHFLTLLLFAAAQAGADDCSFRDGSRLQGTLRALDPEGWLTLESPNASVPLQLRTSALQRVDFSHRHDAVVQGGSRIRLRNGDSFPADIVSLDDKTMVVRTWFAGEIRIPRQTLDAIDFGLASTKELAGAKLSEDGWDGQGWTFREGQWDSFEYSQVLSRKIPLPDQYRIRFRVKWQRMPNLRIFFGCSSPKVMNNDYSGYGITMNREGLEVKRFNEPDGQSPRHVSLATTDKVRFDNTNDQTANVELRVDSKQRLMSLYLDDELIRRFPDESGAPPRGEYVVLHNLENDHGQQTIEAFEITTWDARSERFRETDRSDNNAADVLYDDEGSKFTGKITSISGTDNNSMIVLAHAHAEGGEVRMPARRASTLYFRKPGDEPKEESKGGLLLRLAPEGTLHTSACRMADGKWECTHPLLGTMTLDPRVIGQLEPAPAANP